MVKKPYCEFFCLVCFQFSSGLRHFLQIVCVAMASFAEGYHRHKMGSVALATVSFLNSGKYTVNPEMRAKMIVDVTQKTNMDFCKAFWSLTEGFGIQVSCTAKEIIATKCNKVITCNNNHRHK